MAKILAYDLAILINQIDWTYEDLLRYRVDTTWQYRLSQIKGKYIVIRCDCPFKYVPQVLKWLRINNVEYDSLSLDPDMPDVQEKPVVAIDIDGTLTKEICWNEDQCKKANPSKLVKKVISAYKDVLVVLWTARREEFIPTTLQWMVKNNVPFHAVSTEKMAATLYIDDKTINPVPKKAKKLAKKLLSI